MAIQHTTLFHQGLCTLALAVETEAIRVCLLDPVAGRQRLIAWITVKRDVHAALNGQIATACAHLGQRIERPLWDEQRYRPALNSGGSVHMPRLDAITAAVDPRPPMRVWLAGISHGVSLATAKDAISATPSLLAGETVLDNRLSPEQLASDLSRAQAEVLVFTGGYDSGRANAQHGVLDLGRIIHRAMDLLAPSLRPLVIYAGSKQAAEPLRELFRIPEAGGEEADQPLQIVDNIRPTPQVVMLSGLVQSLQDKRWQLVTYDAGIAALAHWVTPPAQLTTLDWSFARTVQVWAEHLGLEELHSVYNAAAWRQHVWVRRGHARVRMVYTEPNSTHFAPEGWPPIQLWSGHPQAGADAPPQLRWLDRSGMAPLVATVGQISPSAMFQVLERDVFGT